MQGPGIYQIESVLQMRAEPRTNLDLLGSNTGCQAPPPRSIDTMDTMLSQKVSWVIGTRSCPLPLPPMAICFPQIRGV
jgi:hypothetical protein